MMETVFKHSEKHLWLHCQWWLLQDSSQTQDHISRAWKGLYWLYWTLYINHLLTRPSWKKSDKSFMEYNEIPKKS